MSYIGRVEQKASDIRRFNVTGSTSATHTLTWTPPNEQSLIVTINGIKQQEDAYSVSGTTLTLTSALVATDKMEVVGIQDVGETVVPGTGVITNDHISSTAAIDQSKLSLDITNSDINASAAIAMSKLATDPTNASNISSGTLPIARITDHLDHTNVVINGGFDVWQRGTSFSSASYYQDYADRWMGDAHNNTGNTISRQTATASEPFYRFLRFQRDASDTGTGARRIGTVFESQDTAFMSGQEVTLSFYMRKGANWSPATDTVTSYIFTGTGTDESMSGGLGSSWTGYASQSQSNTITTSWTRFTHTVTLSATATQVGINFVTPASVGTAGADDTWDISGIKLELGSVATPYISKSFGETLAKCKRYFESSYPYGTAVGSSGSSTNMPSRIAIGANDTVQEWDFEVEKRSSPTITIYDTGGTSGQVYNFRLGANVAANVENGANRKQFRIYRNGGSNWAANDWIVANYSADAEL